MDNLCQRVKIGLEYLNNNVDRHRGCLPYFATMFKHDPAEARHDWPDFGDLTGRYVESFILARKMLNLSEPGEVERAVRKLLISYFNEGDGLSYRPKPEKPYYSTILGQDYDAHVAEGFDQARVLWGLLTWYDDGGDPAVLRRIQELLAGLDRVMVKREDYGYYDRASWTPGLVVQQSAEPMPHQFYFSGSQIQPLIECARRHGLEQARRLAIRLTNFIVEHSNYFLPDGKWNCPGKTDETWESAVLDGHTHSRFATIAGIATVGIVEGRPDLVEFARRGYDWFVTHHCSRYGWSPEFLGRHGDANEGCETCAVMDQLNCALAFGEAGHPEYYEQAEQIARNQLMANQLLDTRLVRNTVEREDTDQSCFHHVAGMVRGGFAGWAGPNDFIGNCDHHYCLMNCCGPAGLRAMHDVWSNIYRRDGENIHVNILMDRDDSCLTIKHAQPARGHLAITARIDCRLRLLKRSWLAIEGLQIAVNGTPRRAAADGSYLDAGRLAPGERLTFDYDLPEHREPAHVNGRDYTVAWRGDTVVGIDPPGQIMPMYTDRRN